MAALASWKFDEVVNVRTYRDLAGSLSFYARQRLLSRMVVLASATRAAIGRPTASTAWLPGESVADLVELERPDDGSDELHDDIHFLAQ